MKAVLAIDPGSEKSGWVLYDLEMERPFRSGLTPNEDLLVALRAFFASFGNPEAVVVEKIESYGMPVGRETFDTVWWSGRFHEAIVGEFNRMRVEYMPRRDVKIALCGSVKAKDPNVRMALLDRFGGKAAKGTKRSPGPLYGMTADLWAALAVAVTWASSRRAA